MSRLRAAVLLLAIASAPAIGEASEPVPPPPILPVQTDPGTPPTIIRDRATARRLLRNRGVTLQWIDWNTRGTASVTQTRGVWHLRAAQAAPGGGRLFLDGAISEVGAGYFSFDGTIRIADTPDRGRSCEKSKPWHFAVTQQRHYFRLREFEWCDGLTDYIDIHF